MISGLPAMRRKLLGASFEDMNFCEWHLQVSLSADWFGAPSQIASGVGVATWELGRRQRGETELGSEPPAHLRDRFVHLGHTAGTEDERVLAFREGMQADIDASIFRALRELDGFADQRLIVAVVDLERWKAGQISVEHIDPGIVPGHTCPAEPRLAKHFQHRPGEKRVGLGVAFQRLVLYLYVIPG